MAEIPNFWQPLSIPQMHQPPHTSERMGVGWTQEEAISPSALQPRQGVEGMHLQEASGRKPAEG